MGVYPTPRLLPAGDAAVSVELADEISREANTRALTLERLLLDARLPGLSIRSPRSGRSSCTTIRSCCPGGRSRLGSRS
jgi:hypothetical protein